MKIWNIIILLCFALPPAGAKVNPEECLDCHGETDIITEVSPPRKGLYVPGKVFYGSIHGKGSCVDCHADADPDHEGKLKPAVCTECHAPEVKKYQAGLHYKALKKKDPYAPTCVTCHGKHDMLAVDNPKSPVYVMNIPVTCGKCHKEGSDMIKFHDISQKNMVENYSMSIHGRGLFEAGLKVTAVCVSCHMSHDILPHDDTRSSIHRNNISETCMRCHTAIEQVHKQVVKGRNWKQENSVPVCIECHAPHKVKFVKDVFSFDDKYCLSCHNSEHAVSDSAPGMAGMPPAQLDMMGKSAHRDLTCVKCHVNVSMDYSPVCSGSGKVDCASCHKETAQAYVQSAHGKLSADNDPDAPGCVTCHGSHGILARKEKTSPIHRSNIPDLCGKCHKSGQKAALRIGEYSEMVEKYRMSIHGKALTQSGLLVTAVCTDCHTSHRELPADDPNSSVFHANIAGTCAKCHEGIFEKYRLSIHSPEKNPGAVGTLPACNDCHSSHSIGRVDQADFRSSAVVQCGKCHKELVESYFTTYHGKTSKLGDQHTAKCADCHGAHDILPASDTSSHLNPANIRETCRKCHEHANENFVGYLTHANHHDKDKYPALYYAFWAMTLLLLGTFAFFGLHTLLWFPRSLLERIREHKAPKAPSGQWVRRFPDFYLVLHLMVIVSFLSLALTGATLKFSYMKWAVVLSGMFGGAEVMGFIHRIGALITFSYFIIHIVSLVFAVRSSKKSILSFFLNPASIVPGLRDVKEMAATFGWFLGLRKKPEYGRWTYWEKFDYFAVFWGVAIIGSTGLILWFPEFFTRFLPGWMINIATIIHSDEALLAMGFIFTVHFFNTHFRPEKFPMDMVIFTGKVPLETFKEERPEEYQQAVSENRLEEMMAAPPTRRRVITAKIFGFSALFTGFGLVLLIIWAVLH